MKILVKNSIMLAVLLGIGTKLGAMAGSTLSLKKQLFTAIEQDDVAEVKRLIEEGADVNEAKGTGETPLHVAAATNKDDKITRILIAAGADVNAGGKITPLTYAVRYNNKSVAQALIEKGAKLDIVDQRGNTLMDIAKQRGHQDMVQLLTSAMKIQPAAAQEQMQELTDEQIIAKGDITVEDVKKAFPDMQSKDVELFEAYASGLIGAIEAIQLSPALEKTIRPSANIFKKQLDDLRSDWRKFFQ